MLGHVWRSMKWEFVDASMERWSIDKGRRHAASDQFDRLPCTLSVGIDWESRLTNETVVIP